MKLVLFGYGEMGCAGLEFLLARKEDLRAVITHRDDPNEKRWYRSLAEVAKAAGVPVFYGEETDLGETLRAIAPDLILSFYYRSLIPMRLLRIAPRGGLNLHGSKLPRLRGRAPINWALVEGETECGVTLHHMVKAPDAGDLVAQRSWPIGPRDTAKDLFFRAVDEAKLLLRDVWPKIVDGTAPRIPQDASKATYRGRRGPDDGRIDWTKPAAAIDGLVRAVTDPFPGAFSALDGRKLMVWAGAPVPGKGEPGRLIADGVVAAGEGAYRIERCSFADDGSVPALRPGLRLG
jgi:methionyl-tRNA formyltransferase